MYYLTYYRKYKRKNVWVTAKIPKHKTKNHKKLSVAQNLLGGGGGEGRGGGGERRGGGGGGGG